MKNTQQSAKDTDTIRQLVTGYQAARALLAADEINLLHHLQAGPKQVSELAIATKTHEPTLFRFLRAMAAIDIVIVNGKQISKGPLADGLKDAARIGVENYRVWNELPYTLSTGNPAFEKVFGRRFYEYLEDEPEKSERFNTALAAVSMGWISSVLDAVDFTGSNVVADIGGGHGTFLVELLKTNLHLQGILIDQAAVLSRAKTVVESAGVQDRCRMEPTNFLKALPDGADLCSLCNLLVDWDDTNANLILRNCHAAMGDGGRILVVDRVLPPTDDPDHRSAVFLDLFFLLMEGGRLRTEEEYEGLFEAAGFHLIRTFPVGGGFYVLEGISA
jgi:SAM-dependent methyltransferase